MKRVPAITLQPHPTPSLMNTDATTPPVRKAHWNKHNTDPHPATSPAPPSSKTSAAPKRKADKNPQPKMTNPPSSAGAKEK
jgi:hypothetical protein